MSSIGVIILLQIYFIRQTDVVNQLFLSFTRLHFLQAQHDCRFVPSNSGESIFVSGNDVYVSGGYGGVARYCKNGVMVNRTVSAPGSNIIEGARVMVVNESDCILPALLVPAALSPAGIGKHTAFVPLPDCVKALGIIVQ